MEKEDLFSTMHIHKRGCTWLGLVPYKQAAHTHVCMYVLSSQAARRAEYKSLLVVAALSTTLLPKNINLSSTAKTTNHSQATI
jgi:hypothetical protein